MKGTLTRLARDFVKLKICLRGAATPCDPQFIQFVIVAEDKRYWSHWGVDPLALARATFWRLVGRPNGGASTIEMQLVRTISRRRERNVRRKTREILLALRLRTIATKEQIISTYMQRAYFGGGVRGADEASRTLFRRPVASCSPARKAVLAALLVWPVPRRREMHWYRRLFRRARWICEREAEKPDSRRPAERE